MRHMAPEWVTWSRATPADPQMTMVMCYEILDVAGDVTLLW